MSPFLFFDLCAAGGTLEPHGQDLQAALVFEARGLEALEIDVGGSGAPEPNSSVGYARIADDLALVADPRNPLFTTYSGIAVTRSESSPAIACEDGRWVLLFRPSDPLDGESEGIWAALSY
jgi:hypothetical protein